MFGELAEGGRVVKRRRILGEAPVIWRKRRVAGGSTGGEERLAAKNCPVSGSPLFLRTLSGGRPLETLEVFRVLSTCLFETPEGRVVD